MQANSWIKTRSPSNETTAYLRLRMATGIGTCIPTVSGPIIDRVLQVQHQMAYAFQFSSEIQILPVREHWMCGTLVT
jgi:hypothetical protein